MQLFQQLAESLQISTCKKRANLHQACKIDNLIASLMWLFWLCTRGDGTSYDSGDSSCFMLPIVIVPVVMLVLILVIVVMVMVV